MVSGLLLEKFATKENCNENSPSQSPSIAGERQNNATETPVSRTWEEEINESHV
jgi:hypothetical protein